MSEVLLSLDAVRLCAAGRTLVDGLSVEIRAGERWVILGPNGAGKSTLLAALAGARPVDGGNVSTRGRRLGDLSELELARLRALVTDRWVDPFASSVLETLLTARYSLPNDDPTRAGSLATSLLAALDCGELAERDVRRLSRGERQRVAIATALAQDTPVALMDEPTAHQDPRHQAWVIDYLTTLAGTSLVASMHDINAAARFATHALLLTGRASYIAGKAAAVLTDEGLSALFETRITSVILDEARYFRVHPVRR